MDLAGHRFLRCLSVGLFDERHEFLYVEGLGHGGYQIGVFEMLRFFLEARNDDELGFDILPACEEFEDHFSGESWHLEVE